MWMQNYLLKKFYILYINHTIVLIMQTRRDYPGHAQKVLHGGQTSNMLSQRNISL